MDCKGTNIANSLNRPQWLIHILQIAEAMRMDAITILVGDAGGGVGRRNVLEWECYPYDAIITIVVVIVVMASMAVIVVMLVMVVTVEAAHNSF